MDLNNEASERIKEIQILEQNLQNILMQKQAFQFELNEATNAIEEVKTTNEEVYKTLGSIIVKANKEKVLTELEEKKRVLELRLGAIEKQEKLIEARTKELTEEARKHMKNSEK